MKAGKGHNEAQVRTRKNKDSDMRNTVISVDSTTRKERGRIEKITIETSPKPR